MLSEDLLPETKHTSAFDQWFRKGGTLFRCCDPDSASSSFAASVVSNLTDQERWKALFLASNAVGDPDIMDTLVDSSVFEESQDTTRGQCYTYRNCGEAEAGVTEADIIPELNCQMLSALVYSPGTEQNVRQRIYTNPELATSILHIVNSTNAQSVYDLAVFLIEGQLCDGIIFGLDNAQCLWGAKGDNGLFAQLFRLCEKYPRNVRVIASASRIQDLGIIGQSARRLSRDSEYQECLACLHFDRHRERRDAIAKPVPKTGEWVLTHPSFLGWAHQTKGILWIQGKPGCGKSVLARRILDLDPSSEWSARGNSQTSRGRTLLADWFYSTRGGEVLAAHRSLLQALLYQLLGQDPTLFKYFKETYRKHSPASKAWVTVDSLFGILKAIAFGGVQAVCVVDAMDESEDAAADERQRQSVLNHFSELVSKTSPSRMKFLILSRPSPDIEQHFWRHKQQHQNLHFIKFEEGNSGDIKKIIASGIDGLRRDMHPFRSQSEANNVETPSETQLKEPFERKKAREREDVECREIQEYLEQHASGVILWVTVVIAVLKSVVKSGFSTFPLLKQKMRELPQDIHLLYATIVHELASKLSEDGLRRTRHTLMWVSGANTHDTLSLIQLREAMAIRFCTEEATLEQDDPIEANYPPDDWAEFRLNLRRLCGPLIEINPLARSSNTPENASPESSSDALEKVCAQDRVQLRHRTVKDFLANDRFSGDFHFTEVEAIRLVESDCQSYMAVVLPQCETAYSPFPVKEHITQAAPSIAGYLESRVLLPFIYTSFPTDECRLKILDTIIDAPIASRSKPKLGNPWDEELKTCFFMKSRRRHLLPDLEDIVHFQSFSRKMLMTEYIQHACRQGCLQALKFLLLITNESLPGLQEDDEFRGFLVHLAVLFMLERNIFDDTVKEHEHLIQKIHGGEFPAWSPVKTMVECSFDFYTFTLSAYEAAAARSGNVHVAGRMFEMMCTSSHETQLVQRPGKELLLEFAQRNQKPCVAGMSDDEKALIRLLHEYATATVLRSKAAEDEVKDRLPSPRGSPQRRRKKSSIKECKHHCRDSPTKMGRPCRHKCCQRMREW